MGTWSPPCPFQSSSVPSHPPPLSSIHGQDERCLLSGPPPTPTASPENCAGVESFVLSHTGRVHHMGERGNLKAGSHDREEEAEGNEARAQEAKSSAVNFSFACAGEWTAVPEALWLWASRLLVSARCLETKGKEGVLSCTPRPSASVQREMGIYPAPQQACRGLGAQDPGVPPRCAGEL